LRRGTPGRNPVERRPAPKPQCDKDQALPRNASDLPDERPINAEANPLTPMRQHAPTIHIWVRATTDWSDESAFNAQLSPAFAGKVALWNRTFTLPYHLFRHRVCQIASENHAAVAGAVRAGWNEIPDGALVVPVDDDDWFAPDLGERLTAAWRPGIVGLYWTRSFLQVPIDPVAEIGQWASLLFPNRRPKWVCSTNNYAIVKAPDIKRLLRDHTRASGWVLRQPADAIVHLDGRLSLMNRTLASQTSLGWRRVRFSRAELVLKYHRYRRLYRRPLPSELGWAEPYRVAMAELMEGLRLRGGGQS
jgi:hypothetical protein